MDVSRRVCCQCDSEDAYIAQQKFRATPSRGDYEALMKSALENGIQAADGAARRFHKMAREK